MLEEITKLATSRWGLAAVVLLAMPGGRKMLRTVAKEAVRAGLTVSENVKDLVAEIQEEASDVVAEVKAERAGNTSKEKAGQKA
ncbi:MAG: DUF5132 domain-containing protein [Candidatus Melainabacteria bacterium]|nr:DUF5132 domain-containing protein [Candidatus Melainabacteria bacterium]